MSVHPYPTLYEQQQQQYQQRARDDTTRTTTSTQGRAQETWADNGWRSIFDAALVKAQQAVQLDELGETTVAANLYAQAANDLGRVIPMCGSEKKKQSMLAIQAIYLDRVAQLKAGGVLDKQTTSSFSLGESKAHAPETRYSFNDGRGVAYGQEDQHVPRDAYDQQQQQHQHQQHEQLQQQQQPYIPPSSSRNPPQPVENERGSRLFGKKRSKTQSSSRQQLEWVEEGYGHGGGRQGYGLRGSYDDYHGSENASNFSNEHGTSMSASGYISPPYTAPTSSPSPPPVMVSPIFMTHMPSPTPPGPHLPQQQQQQQQQDASVTASASKSSRWKPFGKKKSKSFSAGEAAPIGPYQPSGGYEMPAVIPMVREQQSPNNNPTSASMQADSYLQQQQQQQQHAGWIMDDDDIPSSIDGYDYHARYYDDDEGGDVDPFYIADTKGRARAFEGNHADKAKDPLPVESVEVPKKGSNRKPAALHKASSYSNEQSFAPTFIPSGISHGSQVSHKLDDPAAFERTHAAEYEQDGGVAYAGANYGGLDNNHQPSFDYTSQLQHSPYSVDPSLMQNSGEQSDQPLEQDGGKAKAKSSRWFGKKVRKDGTVETFDEVAKLIDEALFGSGSSVPKKKNKNKSKDRKDNGKEKDEEQLGDALPHQSPSHGSGPVISPRKGSLTENDMGVRQGLGGDRQHYQTGSTEQLPRQQPQPQQGIPDSFSDSQPSLYSPIPQTAQASGTPKALMPVLYAPRTTYTPPLKKQLSLKEGSESSERLTAPPSALDTDVQQTLQPQQHNSDTSPEGPVVSSESGKKSKSRPFNLFKSKKNSSKTLLDQDIRSPLSPTLNPSLILGASEDATSMHSDRTTRSSIQSTDRKAVKISSAVVSKGRESDEYVPYEYQEELEGPLMERVEVPETREVVGFVMPVEDLVDYNLEAPDDAAAFDNWDSWVSQLESFEKVLSNKGLKKQNSKKAKKPKDAKEKERLKEEAPSSPSSSTSPLDSLKANRSNIFGSSNSAGLPNIASTYDPQEHQPASAMVSDNMSHIASRYSFQSSRSSAVLGQDLTIQQISVQQAKKRWWNAKRKEATSLYTVSDSISSTEQDQEQYLSTLLLDHEDVSSQPQQQQQQEQELIVHHKQMDDEEVEETELDQEREDALNALMENSRIISSLPIPQMASQNVSTVDVQEDVRLDSDAKAPESTAISETTEQSGVKSVAVVDYSITSAVEKEAGTAEKQGAVAIQESRTKPKTTSKSSKPKLLPISTPLAQLLKIQNPEELWLYVQQAKTYATARMNKGDKRSAAIALKRAQALETKWQEIMLEMASSDEDEDGLLDDEEDEEEEEVEEEEEKEGEGDASVDEENGRSQDAGRVLQEAQSALSETTAVVQAAPSLTGPAELPGEELKHTSIEDEDEEQDSQDEELARRRMHLRKVTSRSDNAPDMYSRYKVSRSAAPSTPGGPQHSLPVLAEGLTVTGDQAEMEARDNLDGAEGQLGPAATLEQMLETTNKEYLRFYIQRLKTDTVAKARGGSKFAALEGMKSVKMLQQRLEELEGGKDDEREQSEE
ncbi:hypothetical protein EDD11_003291 [Mortierella claussenii]|nr:hypothetical protein EDD11_003291 [Mortierella claussenii]